MNENKPKSKNKIWLSIILFCVFAPIIHSFLILVFYLSESYDYTFNDVKLFFYINFPLSCVFIIVLILLLKFYYKVKIFSRDKLVEDEEGKMVVEKYDKKLEESVKESVSKIDEIMKE